MRNWKLAALSAGILAAGGMLSACGGGSSGSSGSFTNEQVDLNVTASGRDALPLNHEGSGPRVGGAFTATLYVEAENDQGRLNDATFECHLDNVGLDVAELYYLDGTDETEEVVDPDTGETVERLIPSRSVVLESNAGGATFHLHGRENPGEARVLCTVDDPNFEGEVRDDTATVEIGGQTGSGMPTEAWLSPRTGLIWPPGFNGPQTDSVDVFLLDENRGIVDDPEDGQHNLFVEILSGPDAGEYLVGRNADGDTLRGDALPLATEDGATSFQVVSGSEPGFILLGVTSDQEDNNIDNGIAQPVFGATSVVSTTTGFGPPLMIETAEQLPDGTRLESYAVQLEASGGVLPHRWSTAGGSLPMGLSLAESGVVQGTPTGLGESCFIGRVEDSTSPNPEVDQQRFCIEIDGEPPAPATLQIAGRTELTAEAGVGFATILEARGGEKPYRWTLETDDLTPANDGLTLTESGILYWENPQENPQEGPYDVGVYVESDDGQRSEPELYELTVEP